MTLRAEERADRRNRQRPKAWCNINGEWYYEEYAHGAGVSSVGLEDKLPTTADRRGAQEHPRPVQAVA